MKTFLTALLAVLAGVVLLSNMALAQVSGYGFTSSSGTYTEISGGTVLGTISNDDENWNAIPIGFTFTFNGTDYTQASVQTNGFLALGATVVSSYTAISSGSSNNIVVANNADLQGQAGSELSYLTQGIAPNQTFTVQWKNYRHYSGSLENYNFQIILYETSNKAEVVYGSFTEGTGRTAQVGLRGASSADFNNRTTTTDWAASTAGVTNAATMTLSSTVMPPSGLTYDWQLVTQTYASSTVTQNSSPVPANSVNQQIIGIEVVMSGSVSPKNITQFNLNTNGTTSTSDIANARVYYTGTSNVFTTATQFGSTVPTPSGSFNVTGTQTLAGGTNYFWLAYDVVPGATLGNFVDGECTQITVGGVNHVPSVTAPAGNRQIFSLYASLPYSQGFEAGWINKNGTDDVPDGHWLNTPATGNNSWRRQNDGASAGWTAPSTGIVTPSGSTGAADFHSYYAGFGLIGTLDLYMDFSPAGPKVLTFTYQNATGTDQLAVSLSTDGGSTFGAALLTLTSPSTWAPQSVDLGSSTSITCVIRFQATSDFGNDDIGIDNVSVSIPLNNDVGVTVVSPISGSGIFLSGNSYDVGATVKNFGVLSHASIPVYYSVNDGVNPPVTHGPVSTSVVPIPQNGTEAVTFTGGNAFTPSTAGTYTIKSWTLLGGDQVAANDTSTVLVDVVTPLATFPYSENFTLPIGWTYSGDFPWYLAAMTNPNGVASDNAAYVPFYSVSTGSSYLRTPLLNFAALTHPTLDFYVAYRSYSGEDDMLEVMVSTDLGSTWQAGLPILYSKSYLTAPSLATLPMSTTAFFASAATDWRREIVDLTQFAGVSPIIVAFKGTTAYGNNAMVDNVTISNAPSVFSTVVAAPGVYSGSDLSVDFSTIGDAARGRHTPTQQAVKQSAKQLFKFASLPIPRVMVEATEVRSQGTDNPTGGVLTINKYSSAPPSSAVPVFAVNASATEPDGLISQPSTVSANRWWSTSYSGDDYSGQATYSISTDISTLPGVLDPVKLYILKRTDASGSWIAVNTTLSGNTLSAAGLTGFGEFGIGSDTLLNPLPIQLAYLSAQLSANGNSVLVNWGTLTEINNYGFWVEKSPNNQAHYATIQSSFVPGHGTTNEPQRYSYTDNSASSGVWYYRLRQQDMDNTVHYSEGVRVEMVTDVKELAPRVFALTQNYPNPFNPSTEIKFSVEQNGLTTLKIYNILGQEVVTLFNDVAQAGQYYRVRLDANNFASGLYFYKLESGQKKDLKKMLLLK